MCGVCFWNKRLMEFSCRRRVQYYRNAANNLGVPNEEIIYWRQSTLQHRCAFASDDLPPQVYVFFSFFFSARKQIYYFLFLEKKKHTITSEFRWILAGRNAAANRRRLYGVFRLQVEKPPKCFKRVTTNEVTTDYYRTFERSLHCCERSFTAVLSDFEDSIDEFEIPLLHYDFAERTQTTLILVLFQSGFVGDLLKLFNSSDIAKVLYGLICVE